MNLVCGWLSVPNVSGAAIGSSHVGTISPPSGGPGTAFTFAVMYNNTATPTTKNVVVDGTNTIPMSFAKKVGKLDEYTATTTLAPGPHTYTFQFGDGVLNTPPQIEHLLRIISENLAGRGEGNAASKSLEQFRA